MSKHMLGVQATTYEAFEKLMALKLTNNITEEASDPLIKDVCAAYESGVVQNWEFNRNPAKTWTDEKRSKFVSDYLFGSALPPVIIVWRPPNAHYRDPYNVMDGMNRLYALCEVLKGNIPL